MKTFLVTALGAALYALAPAIAQECAPADTLLSEDKGDLARITDPKVMRRPEFITYKDDGSGKNKRIYVTYQGNEIGSPNIWGEFRLRRPAKTAALSYVVNFDPDFVFAKGGKLPGLGTDKRVAPGKPMTPDAWTIRPIFHGDGTVGLYIYHQDKKNLYGVGGTLKRAEPLKLGVDHRIRLEAKMNSGPDERNGHALLFVDGKLVDRFDNARFWADNKASSITNLLFDTFFGGRGPDYAPRKEGRFATVHASFDHILACQTSP